MVVFWFDFTCPSIKIFEMINNLSSLDCLTKMHETPSSNMALHFFHTLEETSESNQKKVVLMYIYKLHRTFIFLI